jgi:hypothetical protein
VHIAAEHLLQLVAEHVEGGAIDKSAATFPVNTVDTLAHRIEKRRALELRVRCSLSIASCSRRRLPELDLRDHAVRNVRQSRNLAIPPVPRLSVNDA